MGIRAYPTVTTDFLDGVPSQDQFGALDMDVPIKLMQMEFRNGNWVYSEDEIDAISRPEPRWARWVDFHGKEHITRWWHETVRCKKNSGVNVGDQLVVSFCPWSVAQVNVAEFVGNARPKIRAAGRAAKQSSAVSAPQPRFARETDFIRWVERQPIEHWDRSDELVARVSKPHLLQDLREQQRQPSSKHQLLLVYGIIHQPDTVDGLVSSLRESEEVQRLLRIAASGKHRRVHPNAGFREFTLLDETKAVTVSLMDLVIRMVLAGPAEDFQEWYGKPITKYVDRTFGDLLNNKNKCESRSSKKARSLEHDPEVPKKKRKKSDELEDESTDSELGLIRLSPGDIKKLRKQLVSEKKELGLVRDNLLELTRSMQSNQERIQQLTLAIQQRES
jgi:hypothetical protein